MFHIGSPNEIFLCVLKASVAAGGKRLATLDEMIHGPFRMATARPDSGQPPPSAARVGETTPFRMSCGSLLFLQFRPEDSGK